MDAVVEATRKKLREAGYFYEQMTRRKAPGSNPEVFQYHLSAFLSAAYAVTELPLRCGDRNWSAFQESWFNNRDALDAELIKFMRDERRRGTHNYRGTGEKLEWEFIPLIIAYSARHR